MNNTVNAQVVGTREPHLFPEQWGVQYQVGDWSTVAMYPSEGEADWHYDYAVQRNIRARRIRIPEEGEEPTKREPATKDEIAKCAARDCADTLYGYEKAWRAAERHHGIGVSDEPKPKKRSKR